MDVVAIFSRVATFWKVPDTSRSRNTTAFISVRKSSVALEVRPSSSCSYAPVGIAIWKFCYFQRERDLIPVAEV